MRDLKYIGLVSVDDQCSGRMIPDPLKFPAAIGLVDVSVQQVKWLEFHEELVKTLKSPVGKVVHIPVSSRRRMGDEKIDPVCIADL